MKGARRDAALAARFGAAAATYDEYAGVQSSAAGRLLRELDRACPGLHPRRVLDLGCGTGVLTVMVRKRFEKAWLCAVDMAEPMVRACARRCGGDDRVSYLVADARCLAVRDGFDLIVSNAALHWMTPLNHTVGRIVGLLRTGGMMAVAVMVAGTLRELHNLRRQVAPHKRPRARLPRAAEVIAAVRLARLRVLRSRTEVLTARYPDARAFLHAIHNQGVTGGDFSRGARPLNRRELRHLVTEYDRRYRTNGGGVVASYRLLYLVGEKP